MERVQDYWKDRPVTLENAKAAPTQDESTLLAFERYRKSRERSDLLEWCLTLLSVTSYGLAIGVVIRGTPATLTTARDDNDARTVIAPPGRRP